MILSAAAGGQVGWLAGLTHGSADPLSGSWRIQDSGHRIHRGAAIPTGRSGSRSLTVLLHLDLTILVCPETSGACVQRGLVVKTADFGADWHSDAGILSVDPINQSNLE